MAGIAVVTDSTADFAGANPADYQITVVPLTVNWGRDVLRDGIDVTTSEFYLRLRTDRTLPRTAAPPLGIFEEVYQQLLTVYDAVISVHIAARLSGTYGVAGTAARNVDAGRVHLVDSTSTSVGLGWLALRAAQRAQAGASAESILQELAGMIPRLRLFLTLDTLEYLQRGGRIGRAQAFLGSLLNVKPILQLLNGEVLPVERVRTRTASLRRVAEITGTAGPKEALAIVHGDCDSEARALQQDVGRREGTTAAPIVELGSVLAAHAGPGVIGVGCLLAQGSGVDR